MDCKSLPWGSPEFSHLFLEVQLDRETDQATRRMDRVLGECAFIDGCLQTFVGKNLNILDLTCGPGFYATEFARMGHSVVGVDFSPAAIEYAETQLQGADLPIKYMLQDLLTSEFPAQSFDGCIYIYGMPNIIERSQLVLMLEKINTWLKPGGVFISEIASIEALRDDCDRDWDTRDRSALSARPHLWLDEKIWHEPTCSQVYRIYTIDLETGHTNEFAESHQGYTIREYSDMLESTGFDVRDVFSDLFGNDLTDDPEWLVFVAQKP